MSKIIEAIEEKTKELVEDGDQLLQSLQEFGWKDDRPDRTPEQEIVTSSFDDMLKGLSETQTQTIPATARIPVDFVQSYHQWYAACLAVVEANMPSRLAELAALHKGANTELMKGSITFEDQVRLADRIVQVRAVIASIPQYLEGRLHDLELAVAQAYVGDQLAEAQALLKAGYTRAAGAIAGVLLERHLRLLCGRHQPPIKYRKNAGITKLNDALKSAGVYDVVQWRKVQWMGDIRNQCDHPKATEPREGDIADLIAEVSKFAALFVI